MKFLFVVFILVGALFVDESVQDCRTSKRRIETSTFTPTDPTPGVRTVGFRFTYFDTRECDDSDKDGFVFFFFFLFFFRFFFLLFVCLVDCFSFFVRF